MHKYLPSRWLHLIFVVHLIALICNDCACILSMCMLGSWIFHFSDIQHTCTCTDRNTHSSQCWVSCSWNWECHRDPMSKRSWSHTWTWRHNPTLYQSSSLSFLHLLMFFFSSVFGSSVSRNRWKKDLFQCLGFLRNSWAWSWKKQCGRAVHLCAGVGVFPLWHAKPMTPTAQCLQTH